MELITILRGLGGLVIVTALAYVFSSSRRAINWRLVGVGFILQFGFAFLVLRTTIGREIFSQISKFFVFLFSFASEGAQFVFGPLAVAPGGREASG